MNTIERIHKPTREVFERNFFSPPKPCIITGAMDNWKALSLWKLDYLKATIGDKVVPCRESSSEYFVNNYNGSQNIKHKSIKIFQFLDWLIWEQSPKFFDWLMPERASKKYYVTGLDIPKYLP